MKTLAKIALSTLLICAAYASAQTTYTITGAAGQPAPGTLFIDKTGITIYQDGVASGWVNLYMNTNQYTKEIYGIISINLWTVPNQYIQYTNKTYALDSADMFPLSGSVNWALIKWPTAPACYPAANNCGSMYMHGTASDGTTATVNTGTLNYQGYSSGRGGGYRDEMALTEGTIVVQ